jgi:transposase-like protein
MRPGVSLALLAMSNQVNANQLRRWIHLHDHRHAEASAAATLLSMTLALPEPSAPAATCTPGVAVTIEAGGAVLRVQDGAPAATLRTVLACVRCTAA